MLRPRQFSLLQLIVTVTAVAAYCGLVRFLLVSGRTAQILFWGEAALTLFVGSILTLVGSWLLYHAVRQTLFWPKAAATMLRYCIKRSEGHPDGQPFYYAVLRFETRGGQTITTMSNCGSWRRPWERGSSVTVRYNPANPRWAELATFANVWAMPLVFLVLAAGALVRLIWFRGAGW